MEAMIIIKFLLLMCKVLVTMSFVAGVVFLSFTLDKKFYVKLAKMKHGYISIIPEVCLRIDLRKDIVNRNVSLHVDFLSHMYVYALYNTAESRREKRRKQVIPTIRMKKV